MSSAAPSVVPAEASRTAAAEAALAVASSSASTFTSEEGGVASVPAADAAVTVASSATLRRMYERKEDMRPAVGGGAVTGSGPMSTATPMPTVEVTVAVVPATASLAVSREGGAARIVAAEVTGTVASPLTSEGTVGKWEAELPPVLVSR